MEDEFLQGNILQQVLLERPGMAERLLALKHLAESLSKNHGDLWLGDFLRAPTSQRADLLLKTAITANHAGTPDQAVRAAVVASGIYKKQGNIAGAQRSEFERAYALRRLSRASQCLKVAKATSGESQRLQYSWIDAQARMEQANCEEMLGSLDAARASSREALQKALQARYRNLQLRELGQSSNMAMVEGRSEVAWAIAEEGLRLFWQDVFPDDRAFQFYYNLEVDSERRHAFYLAAALQKETVKMVAGRSRLDFEAMAHFRMALAGGETGDTRMEEYELGLYRNLLDQMPPSSARSIYQAYGEIGLARLSMMNLSNADAAAHLNEARRLLPQNDNSLLQLEYLKTSADLDRRQADTADEEDRLKEILSIAARGFEHLSSPADRWRWREVTDSSYRRLLEIELSRPHSTDDSFYYWQSYLRLQSAPSLQSSPLLFDPPNVTDMSWPDIKGKSLISFAVLRQSVVVWVLNHGVLRELVLRIDISELRQEIERFRLLCSDPDSSVAKVNASGARLYGWLITPLEPFLDAEQPWAIQPDGPLSLIPWPALVTPKRDYLGNVRTLSIYPGVFSAHGPSKREDVKTVIVASPGAVRLENKMLLPIPQAEDVVSEVEQLYPETTHLQGIAVTPANLIRELPESDIFAFEGHAVTREHGGELVVHEGDHGTILSASSISNLRLTHTRLVVLAACSTAAEVDSDLDPSGLVRAFLNAGAAEVVAGRWNVDSEATTGLLKEFYRSFRSGLSAPQALAHSRHFIASQNRFAHPYYWAGIEIFSVN